MTPIVDAHRPEQRGGGRGRKRIVLAIKLSVSVAILVEIYRRVLGREGAEQVLGHLDRLHWGWFALAVAMQLAAIACGVVRWHRLLVGQGIHAPWGFLASSWMIGRFWGAITPGGLGLDGWRLYETAKYTGKIARPTALAAVEKVLGQLAFGAVVMAGSIFGLRFLGTSGVLLVNGLFLGLVLGGLTLLARPALFRALAGFLPAGVQRRVASLVDAVCAYHGKGSLLVQAALLGVGVHAFNNLIYVCAARALGIDLEVGAVFFASSLQIMATLLPTSINGIGLREAAAVALYTSPAVGLSMAEAVLIPTVGFAAEMLVSSIGAIVFLTRTASYRPSIAVDDPERERLVSAEIAAVPESEWPRVGRGVTIGLGAGLLAGAVVGIGEGIVVVLSGRTGGWVVAYGAIAYELFCALAGAALGGASALSGRILRRAAVAEPVAYARMTAFWVAVCAFALGAFRIRRDVFEEELAWRSAAGFGVLLGCALAAGLLYLAVAATVRFAVERRPGAILLRAWGSPAFVGALCATLAAATFWVGQPAEADGTRHRSTPPSGAGNVLVIVVDTLRADHLPAYGYERGHTPNLDAFAEDAIRFDQAFSNSSWTRPSFASILTGRHASSHGVMSKADALPDELVTLAEAFQRGGWHTAAFVTNYNVAPYFHFDQGFDEYHYLEPEFVLWADDSAAKLLLVQYLRQRIEIVRDAFFGVRPGTAYRDAETVNRELFRWLDRAPREPWLLFVGYMDPHDPYFEHPYSGSGYARAAHPSPSMAERDRLVELYDGEITYWDEQFGKLMAALRERGLYEDLTIVVTADHGEEFGEHGGFWHGTTLYDEQVRVPLFVKLPRGRRAGTVVRHWVQSIDLMPTLLLQAGLPVPEGVQGGDLFEGTDVVYAEESHEGNVLESIRTLQGTDEVKLILANPGNPRRLPERELFRVDLDPRETRDLSGTEPELLERARLALQAARVRAAEGAVGAQEVEIDPEQRRQLCRLGYLRGKACEH
jgi:arylsulfatase A-like enzyme/uncharacterized membrane protein YbhN (UPF0104 family)